MTGVNKVILIGHLGKDPETKYLEGNIAKTTFSLATSDSYKDKSGKRVDQTEWHNIILWRGLAESAEKILKKGLQVYVEGKITYREWTNKEGVTKNVTEIVGDSYIILQKKENSSAGNTETFSSGNIENLDEGGIPF
jgi:single-strand DNA-binding protein